MSQNPAACHSNPYMMILIQETMRDLICSLFDEPVLESKRHHLILGGVDLECPLQRLIAPRSLPSAAARLHIGPAVPQIPFPKM
jgi:hypothetical protein